MARSRSPAKARRPRSTHAAREAAPAMTRRSSPYSWRRQSSSMVPRWRPPKHREYIDLRRTSLTPWRPTTVLVGVEAAVAEREYIDPRRRGDQEAKAAVAEHLEALRRKLRKKQHFEGVVADLAATLWRPLQPLPNESAAGLRPAAVPVAVADSEEMERSSG